MPPDIRARLEEAAKKRGWSLSQEALYRIRNSYNRARDEHRRPEARALGYLIAMLVDDVRIGSNSDKDLTADPALFAAFKIAVELLLAKLKPPGGAVCNGMFQTPEEHGAYLADIFWRRLSGEDRSIANQIDDAMKSPEAQTILKFLADSGTPLKPSDLEHFKEYVRDSDYSFDDARRDLKINPQGDDK